MKYKTFTPEKKASRPLLLPHNNFTRTTLIEMMLPTRLRRAPTAFFPRLTVRSNCNPFPGNHHHPPRPVARTVIAPKADSDFRRNAASVFPTAPAGHRPPAKRYQRTDRSLAVRSGRSRDIRRFGSSVSTDRKRAHECLRCCCCCVVLRERFPRGNRTLPAVLCAIRPAQ